MGMTRGRPRLQIDMEQLRQMQARGLSLRQIAQEVGVSKSTVSTYLRNCVQNMSEKYQDAMSPPGGSQGSPEAVVDPRANQVAKTIMKQEKGGGSLDVPVGALKKSYAHRPKYSDEEKKLIKARIVEVMGDEFTLGVACRVVGIRRDTAVAWQEQDSEFKDVCDSQMETYLDRIENKMVQRALDMKQPHDATQGMFILNGYRRERFAPMMKHEHSGAGGGPILLAVAAKIKNMDTDTLRFELGKLLGTAVVEVQAQPEQEEQR